MPYRGDSDPKTEEEKNNSAVYVVPEEQTCQTSLAREVKRLGLATADTAAKCQSIVTANVG